MDIKRTVAMRKFFIVVLIIVSLNSCDYIKGKYFYSYPINKFGKGCTCKLYGELYKFGTKTNVFLTDSSSFRVKIGSYSYDDSFINIRCLESFIEVEFTERFDQYDIKMKGDSDIMIPKSSVRKGSSIDTFKVVNKYIYKLDSLKALKNY